MQAQCVLCVCNEAQNKCSHSYITDCNGFKVNLKLLFGRMLDMQCVAYVHFRRVLARCLFISNAE